MAVFKSERVSAGFLKHYPGAKIERLKAMGPSRGRYQAEISIPGGEKPISLALPVRAEQGLRPDGKTVKLTLEPEQKRTGVPVGPLDQLILALSFALENREPEGAGPESRPVEWRLRGCSWNRHLQGLVVRGMGFQLPDRSHIVPQEGRRPKGFFRLKIKPT